MEKLNIYKVGMGKFKNTIFLSGKKQQLYKDISNNTLTIHQGLQEQYQYILTQTNGSKYRRRISR